MLICYYRLLRNGGSIVRSGHDRHFFLVLAGQVRLELLALLRVVSLVHIEDELARVHRLHKSLKLSIVRVRRVGHFEVEWQVLVVFVVPAGQDDEDSGLLAIALVYAEQDSELIGGA